MRLSQHFTLEEMTKSQSASRLRIDNTPPEDVVKNLTNLAYRDWETDRKSTRLNSSHRL